MPALLQIAARIVSIFVEDLTHKSFNLADYLSRPYMGHIQDQDPRMTLALSRISNWGSGALVSLRLHNVSLLWTRLVRDFISILRASISLT
jgi:hypothetical protein